VQFYLASHYGPEPWPGEHYPHDVVFDMIVALPPKKRRVPTANKLFGERVFRVWFDRPDPRLLSVENVELGAQLRYSDEGEIATHQFAPGAGPAEPTYVMFLEHGVVGIVRLGNGPRVRQVCVSLEVFTGYGLTLTPLLDPVVDRRLANRDPAEVTRLKFSTVRGRAERIAQATRLGEVFAKAEEVFPGVEEITLIVGVETAPNSRGRFWPNAKRNVVDKLWSDEDALELLAEADVYMEGERHVSMFEDLIVWTGSVEADERTHVDDRTISVAIQSAYEENRAAILDAIGA
jgi:hypothetical protein